MTEIFVQDIVDIGLELEVDDRLDEISSEDEML